jgi:hypothetical protein
MRRPINDLPLVEDYGEGFQGRQIEWGGMIVSYEFFTALAGDGGGTDLVDPSR